MKQEIDIEGLPEGWKAVAYRCPLHDEWVLSQREVKLGKYVDQAFENLIVEKIQPRRIVLEETEEDNQKDRIKNVFCMQYFRDNILLANQPKIWREVKE